MGKGTLYIDSDGFFWPSDISDEYMHNRRKGISFEREPQPLDTLFEQYYLGFRSSIIICEDTIESITDAKKILEDFCKACLESAREYAIKHLTSEVSLPVDFMWITKMKIINEIKDTYPEAEKIPLLLTMKPSISARANNKHTIVFPALLRSVLNHCNLVLVNSAYQTMDANLEEIDYRYVSRFIFPYLLFCHDDLSVRNLPIVGGHSKEAICTALSYTNLQVMYIFAHEYGHILLKHFDDEIISPKSQEVKENEADAFALDVVLRYIDKNNEYTKADVFTSIRWLFKYQLLEESIGILSRNGNYSTFLSEYERRRSCFQLDLINKCGTQLTTLVDAIGFASIVELQNILNRHRTNLIDTIIQAFNNSKIKGVVDPWWEMIS